MTNASGIQISRRGLLRSGLYGTAGWWLAGPKALANEAPVIKPKAKAVIQIWMWGGPPHLDTFDPKPSAGYDYCGEFNKDIPTNVPGTHIGEHLPLLAQQANRYSIIRSMTHGNNGHETASYMVQTGRKPGEDQVYPAVGAVVSRFKGYDAGYKGLIPPYIVLTRPQGRFSESGFMGTKYKPFATGGDPGRPKFAVEGVVAEGITEERQRARREFLQSSDMLRVALKGDPRVEAFGKAENEAYDLILGDAGKVFDLSEEPIEMRDKYGRGTFGASCLAARRLVERGVPFVTINYNGWDTHRQHFQIMNRMLPELDRGFATLIEDLADRGLLDSTIVWWGGEFGRTPKIDWSPPWNGGRHHFGRVFSTVMAGGGFKGGAVLGKSDEKGDYVAERPVYPWDLIMTMYALLGIDPMATLPHPQQLQLRAVATPEEGYDMGGMVTELV